MLTRDETIDALRRFRYGGVALWTVEGDLAGSTARRLERRVDVHFGEGGGPLLVDLRGAGLVDDAGAGALARCGAAHEAFATVGRPVAWRDLPAGLRRRLAALRSHGDLEGALVAATARRAGGAEQRRHQRVPLQVPVELFLDGRTAPATLRDLSRGGGRFDLVHPEWIDALWEREPATAFAVIGLGVDPLGREIAPSSARGPLPAVAVRRLDQRGLGVRFLLPEPPT